MRTTRVKRRKILGVVAGILLIGLLQRGKIERTDGYGNGEYGTDSYGK